MREEEILVEFFDRKGSRVYRYVCPDTEITRSFYQRGMRAGVVHAFPPDSERGAFTKWRVVEADKTKRGWEAVVEKIDDGERIVLKN